MVQLETEPNDLFIIQVYMPTPKVEDEEIEKDFCGMRNESLINYKMYEKKK